MKCTVNAGELLAGLRVVQARAKISSLEILRHIRFDVTDGAVALLGHDLDSSSEAMVDADDTEKGTCAIPADPLIRLVAGLQKSANIILDLDGRQLTVKSGRSRYKLPTMDTADFPAALAAEGGIKVNVTKADIEQLFDRPRAALDPKDQRPISSGVFLHDEAGKLVSGGYAHHDLMRFASGIDADGFAGVMISRSSIDEIIKIGEGELSISERIVSIRAGSRVYSSKLIDARFPDAYRRVIPEASGPHIAVDRAEFMECLARLASIAEFSASNLIDISVGKGDVSASLIGMADGSEMLECVVHEASGKFVCMKGTQLLDACKAMKGPTLHIYIRGEMDPVRIVDPEEPSAVNVQMPCLSKNRKAEAA